MVLLEMDERVEQCSGPWNRENFSDYDATAVDVASSFHANRFRESRRMRNRICLHVCHVRNNELDGRRGPGLRDPH